MADEFERFLGSSLKPPERLPDRRFVAAVHARILLEERLGAQRRGLLKGLVTQLLALLAIAAAAWWIGKAASVANLFARAPWLGALVLLVAFGFVVALFSMSGRPALRSVHIS